MATVTPTLSRRPTVTATQNRPWLPTRWRLILVGIGIALVALLASLTATNAYTTTYRLFENIARFYSTKVDAAENALQDLANTSQAAADYTALSSDTPLFEQASNDIFRAFNSYRGQMFIIQSNLQTEAERAAFVVADTYTYSRFWRHIGNLIDDRSNDSVARREYLAADNHLRNRIIPALEQVEALNFDLMVQAGNDASALINGQALLVGLTGGLAALVMTAFSFWLRRKVRRYLTPGVDLALLIAWGICVGMVLHLASLPAQLFTMTNNAYYSISNVSQVLVSANLANRAESSAIIDASRAEAWFAQFDAIVADMETHLCGAAGCLQTGFLADNAAIDPSVITRARQATQAGSLPLVANATFAGEALALEEARRAYVDYLNIHAELKALVLAGDADSLSAATELNTGTDDGDSEAAFARFTAAMANVEQINRQVFNDIWAQQQQQIPAWQGLFGIMGYALLVILVAIGINQRFREF